MEINKKKPGRPKKEDKQHKLLKHINYITIYMDFTNKN